MRVNVVASTLIAWTSRLLRSGRDAAPWYRELRVVHAAVWHVRLLRKRASWDATARECHLRVVHA